MLTSALRRFAGSTFLISLTLTLIACGSSSSRPEPEPPRVTTPAAFSFDAVKEAEPGSTLTSNRITIKEINTPVPITIEGGEYALNGSDEYTAENGEARVNDTIVLQAIAPGPSSDHEVTLTVGDRSATWVITTLDDTQPPEAAFAFPPPMSATDAETLTVRGTAQDDWSEVTQVTLTVENEGGTEIFALESENGFTTWSREITLAPGQNSLWVSAEDEWGNASGETARIQVHQQAFADSFPDNEVPFTGIHGMTLDYRNGRVLLSDWGSDYSGVIDGRIIAVDLATSQRTVFSGNGVPDQENNLGLVFGLEMDYARDQVLLGVGAHEDSSVFSVDINTGQRSILSGPAIPDEEQPPISRITGITLDPSDSDQVYLVANGNSRLLRMGVGHEEDGAGKREVVSGGGIGEGESIGGPSEMVISLDHRYAYMIDVSHTPLFRIDLDTGEREVANWDSYPLNRVSTPRLQSIVATENRQLLYLFDRLEGIVSFRPETEEWTLVKEFEFLTRFERSIIAYLYLIDIDQYLLFADRETSGVYALDLETKEYVVVSKSVADN